MNLTLIQDWNGLPSGFRLVGVQAGQAELMIQRGLAVVTQKVEQKQNQQRKK